MSSGPRRPSVPTLAWFAVAMWSGCMAGEHASWSLWGGRPVAPACVAVGGVLAGLGVAAVRCRRSRVLVALIACGLVTGAFVSSVQGWAWHRQSALAADCGAREWTGVVEADPAEGAFGAVVRVRVTGGPLDGARVRVGWPAEQDVPELGRMVRFSAIMRTLPADEAWARGVARGGACATGTAWRAGTGPWREGIVGTLLAWREGVLQRMHGVSGDGGDLIEGIVLGDRRRLVGTPVEEDFRVLGLTHLVAVSGSHLALACGAVAALGRAVRLPRTALVGTVIAAGAAYAVTTGMPYSALRSLVMLVVGGLATLGRRRGDATASLAAAVVVVVAIEPWSVFDIGLQLSVLAVGALLVFGGLASSWLAHGLRGPASAVGSVLALTLVAQLATTPVVAGAFGMVSLMAPVANAYASPLVAVGLWLGLSGSVVGSVWAAAGDLAIRAGSAVMGLAAQIAHVMARLPGAAIAVEGGWLLVGVPLAGAAAAWIVWPLPAGPDSARRVRAVVLVSCVALTLGPAPARRCEIVALDVGQGDAIVLRDSGRTMLVDTGADELSMRRALARAGVRRVDVLVLTHAHDDHTGGVGGLSGTASVGWVGVPQVAAEAVRRQGAVARAIAGADSGYRGLRIGDRWRIGSSGVEVLWPPGESAEPLGTNDTSVVLQVRCGGFDAVLTGDAEEAAQAGMAEAGLLRPVEVLKVPHHGSDNGLTREAASVWSARDALVSVGADNSFGHPSSATLELLGSSGTRVWRTDVSGDITVSIGRTGYRIHVSGRGARPEVRARMSRVARAESVPVCGPSPYLEETRGRQRHPGTQARLSGLRRRTVAPRARAPPPEGPGSRGRRSRLQLRHLRRRDRRRRRGRCGGQHAAVRLGAASRGRAQRR